MSGSKRLTAPTVRGAIQQTRPFRSIGQEAVIALALTSEAVRWPFQDLLAQEGDLTAQQFNVLRILRGAGADGLPTLEIADRMIERTPGVTRLLDRMERKGLVTRARSADDRRQVWCQITRQGRKILSGLDAPIDALDDRLFDALTKKETKTLIGLLNQLRTSLGSDS
jgi:DNA-binding MarR family transcriptional regulator